MNKNPFKKDSFRIDLLDKEQVETFAKKVLSEMEKHEGMTVQEALGVSDDALEEVYGLAYMYYNQAKYQEANALFQLLASSAPSNFKYVLGLASTYHQMKAYEDAAVGFYVALNIDPENPFPAYYITDCFLKQNLLEEAKEFAEITIEICEDREEYAALKNRCRLILKSF